MNSKTGLLNVASDHKIFTYTRFFKKTIGSSQPKARLLSPQKNKKELSMARRMTIILHLTSQLLPALVNVLNYQNALSSFLTGSHYRE